MAYRTSFAGMAFQLERLHPWNVVQLGHIPKEALMATCVPVRDLKSTAEFAALVEREHDVAVTKNGYEIMHCLSEHEYRIVQDEVARARLLSRMLLAEQEMEADAYGDYDEFAASLRNEYGL